MVHHPAFASAHLVRKILFESNNQPHRTVAVVPQSVETNPARALPLTEKYVVKYIPWYVPLQRTVVKIGSKRRMCLFFNAFQILRRPPSSETSFSELNVGCFPSFRMSPWGGEMVNARGSPAHESPIITRYVFGLILPCLESPTFNANWTELPIIDPILFRACQMAT